MTPQMVSGLMGQWIGIIIFVAATYFCYEGIKIEKKYKADKGFVYVTIGGVLLGVGGIIFSIGTKLLGF